MQNYLVEVSLNDPYPKRFNYRTTGSSFSVAVGKALRMFRAEFKGRRVKEATIKFQHYASLPSTPDRA